MSPLIVFDNATGVGRRVGEIIHEAKLFQRMGRITASPCVSQPGIGPREGERRKQIGYTRRNLFVPAGVHPHRGVQPPTAGLARGQGGGGAYKKLQPIGQLFEVDRSALMPPPRMPFDVVRYEYVKADGYGKVRIDALGPLFHVPGSTQGRRCW